MVAQSKFVSLPAPAMLYAVNRSIHPLFLKNHETPRETRLRKQIECLQCGRQCHHHHHKEECFHPMPILRRERTPPPCRIPMALRTFTSTTFRTAVRRNPHRHQRKCRRCSGFPIQCRCRPPLPRLCMHHIQHIHIPPRLLRPTVLLTIISNISSRR